MISPSAVPVETVESGTASLCMLLVEDDAIDRMAFERFVRREAPNVELRVATSCASALEILAVESFEVVLTDYHLGDGSALEILGLNLQCPVVVITGAGDEDIAVQAMRAGAFDYLTKDREGRYFKLVRVTLESARRHFAAQRESQRLARALLESEERYALAAAGANDGLWDFDLRTSRIFFSPRFKEILGFSADFEIGDLAGWRDLVHSDDLELFNAHLAAHLAGQSPHLEVDYRIATREGSYRWVSARGLAVRSGNEAVRLAGSQRDITDRKLVEEQLAHAALHDALTGLPNRALFMDRLNSTLLRHRRHPERHFGVVFFDLDRFKVINDSLGHLAGDRLLQALAERLRTCVRLSDTIARLGGDEFGVLVEEVGTAAAVEEVAARIEAAFQAPFVIDGHEVWTTASQGISLCSPLYQQAEDMLRDADTAMYKAKALGQRQRVFFEPGMHRDAVARLHLENDLRRALEHGELRVAFQPVVDLQNGALRGFEALVRWQHAERGLLLPGAFFGVAQEIGLSGPIGWWVLDQACRLMGAWQREFGAWDLTLAVNIDAAQLVSGDLVERVEQALGDLAPENLRLELTEDHLIGDVGRLRELLVRLRARRVEIHIDDFGTGYSSLAQLRQLPIDVLKIDRSFVSRMHAEESAFEIVRTIIQLAHNLGLEVLAEGIETIDQLNVLRELGCPLGQGFLFAPGLMPAEARAWLENGPGPLPGFEEPGI